MQSEISSREEAKNTENLPPQDKIKRKNAGPY